MIVFVFTVMLKKQTNKKQIKTTPKQDLFKNNMDNQNIKYKKSLSAIYILLFMRLVHVNTKISDQKKPSEL